ncbi:hypothetical protein Dimus_015805 [Dionaea muscipula]
MFVEAIVVKVADVDAKVIHSTDDVATVVAGTNVASTEVPSMDVPDRDVAPTGVGSTSVTTTTTFSTSGAATDLVSQSDKDTDAVVATVIADVGGMDQTVMDLLAMDLLDTNMKKQDDVGFLELYTPHHGQIPGTNVPGPIRSVRVIGEGRTATREEGDTHQEPAPHLSSPSLSLDDNHVRKAESSPASLPTTAIEGEQQRVQPPATSPVTVLADRRRLSPRKKHATTVHRLATTISQLSSPSKRSLFISSHQAPPAHSFIINQRQLLSPSCHPQPPRRTTICLIIVHDRDEKDS